MCIPRGSPRPREHRGAEPTGIENERVHAGILQAREEPVVQHLLVCRVDLKGPDHVPGGRDPRHAAGYSLDASLRSCTLAKKRQKYDNDSRYRGGGGERIRASTALGSGGSCHVAAYRPTRWVPQSLSRATFAVPDGFAKAQVAAVHTPSSMASRREIRLVQRTVAACPGRSYHPVMSAPPQSSPELDLLSPREIEVLEMISLGLTNRDVANRLGVTVHAIKFHLTSIYRKLAVANRTEAAVTFSQRNSVPSVLGRLES